MSNTGLRKSCRDQNRQKRLVFYNGLQHLNQQLMRENTQLSVHQKRCVEVTAERLERLLLTGIGEILPYERRWSKSPMVWNMSPVWDVL